MIRIAVLLLGLCIPLCGAIAGQPLPEGHVAGAAVVTDRARVGVSDWLDQWIGTEPHRIHWWQMTIHGLLIFVFALLLVRIGRRAFERSAPIDIVVGVLIGSNLSRAFTANAAFVPTLIATAAVVALYWVIIHAAVYSGWISVSVKGRKYQLVHNGEIDRVVMERHGIAEDDLLEAMRCSGIKRLDQIEAAYLERNGAISLLRRDD